jgi:hypothetical protein
LTPADWADLWRDVATRVADHREAGRGHLGWSGENPKQLAVYVAAINTGKRPRCRERMLRTDYVDDLRHRVAAHG